MQGISCGKNLYSNPINSEFYGFCIIYGYLLVLTRRLLRLYNVEHEFYTSRMKSTGCRAALLGFVASHSFLSCAASPASLQHPISAVPTSAAIHKSIPQGLPGTMIPDGLCVNIHFTDARPGEMEMLAQGGFRWIRMDFVWGATEKVRGQYDFTAYDRLLKDLEAHGIRPVFILDYGNPLYAPATADDPASRDWSPRTPEARKAMAQWASAAVSHFKGHGIIWEMWNEPNIGFWKPQPNVQEYSALALEVGKAIRATAPQELYVGPATSGDDLPYLEACFKAGLLNYWDAVSVHSYRQTGPETASTDLAKVSALIAQYAPKGKTIPILSGEWGYSAAWDNYNEVEQGKMLPRQWLVNSMNGVPLSIWYDWHDDGTDPKEGEHHFGTVANPYLEGQTPPYAPKPAYLAAQTLVRALSSFHYNKRLWTGTPDDYVLLFSREVKGRTETKLAVWTTSRTPHTVALPVAAATFDATDMTGSASLVTAQSGKLTLTLTDSPQYLAPRGADPLLQVAASWNTVPSEMVVRGPQQFPMLMSLHNPLKQQISVYNFTGNQTVQPLKGGGETKFTDLVGVTRDAQSKQQKFQCEVETGGHRATFTQVTTFIVQNPLYLIVAPLDEHLYGLYLDNLSGDATYGQVSFTTQLTGGAAKEDQKVDVTLKAGETTSISAFAPQYADVDQLGVSDLKLQSGGRTIAVSPTYHWSVTAGAVPSDEGSLTSTYKVLPDGNPQIASTQHLSISHEASVASPFSGQPVQLDYNFDAGWKFVRVVPLTPALQQIPANTRALGLWVNGDGSGNLARMRFSDATGQTFQSDGPPLTWRGWRYVQFSLDGKAGGHWGGAGDGIPHAPLHLDTLLLIDSAHQQKTSGRIFFSTPAYIQ